MRASGALSIKGNASFDPGLASQAGYPSCRAKVELNKLLLRSEYNYFG